MANTVDHTKSKEWLRVLKSSFYLGWSISRMSQVQENNDNK